MVGDDPVEAADRNTLARPILTSTNAIFVARATDHHLRRWPRYFRRASQCHVAKQDRTTTSVYPWTGRTPRQRVTTRVIGTHVHVIDRYQSRNGSFVFRRVAARSFRESLLHALENSRFPFTRTEKRQTRPVRVDQFLNGEIHR